MFQNGDNLLWPIFGPTLIEDGLKFLLWSLKSYINVVVTYVSDFILTFKTTRCIFILRFKNILTRDEQIVKKIVLIFLVRIGAVLYNVARFEYV